MFPPGVKKDMVKLLWKRALPHEKGTFTRALHYRGHFGNGTLLQQEHTDACFTLLFSFLQPYFSFLPLFLFSPIPTWIGTASNTHLQSTCTLQVYFHFYMIAQYFDPWPPTSNRLSTGSLLLSSINYLDYKPHLQCSNTHCQDTLSVQTLFNWLIGVTYKFWGIIIKTLSWLSDNKQRNEAVNHCENCLIYHFSLQHLKI